MTVIASNPYNGSGWTLSINTVVIDNILDYVPPKVKVNPIDFKPLGNQWVKRLPGMTDGGESTFTCILDEASTAHAALYTLLGAPEVVPVVATNTKSGKKYSYDALLTGLDPDKQDNDTLSTYVGTLSVSGEVVIADAP